jgi:NAD+ synthase (glutamine-hydrolysing)
MLDFIRIACAVPAVKVGDVEKNTADICAYMEKADAQNVDIIVFPELALTGYSCADLFFQDSLLDAVKVGLRQVAFCSGKYPKLTAVVGLPIMIGTKLYNCAAVINRGEVTGIIPKTHLPNYNEFSEKRWFASGAELENTWLTPEDLGLVPSEDYYGIPVGTKQLFIVGGNAAVGIEICEDFLAPIPASGALAMNGAEVILNLSASNDTAGKRAGRSDRVRIQSAICDCVYAYVSAGHTESTADLVFSGHSIIAENGVILAESTTPLVTDYMLVQDCDLGKIRADRRRNQYFASLHDSEKNGFHIRDLNGDGLRSDGTLYPLRKLVFVPSQQQARKDRCLEIFRLQVAGLKQRLATINTNAVIGISGGLDSTLALLVAVEAMRQLGRPLTDVYGVTMPCFGTSDRTYHNSWELMRTLGISAKEINIRKAVTLHFEDIGHDINIHNGTFENSQARERTQILMDYASVVNGIVVGTGDLSELALGWCTYNGDHMSMYGVNGTVPKTLIRWIIEAVAEQPEFAASRPVLQDVLDTPISPELLPPDAQGKISQQTEDIVGPYALHDFFLFYMVRYGFTPTKIYTLACRAFKDDFDAATVKKWLTTFYKRFFSQQFKRNCMPDGVKTGSVGLGPRGDWRMPSDATGKVWLKEIENL